MQASSKAAGFSLVELLISAAILGILLTTLALFLNSQQKVTTEQISQVTLTNAAKLSLERMQDIVAQANYIFPAGQTISLNNPGQGKNLSIVTGSRTLAVLIPNGTSYCQLTDLTAKRYCGFLWTIEGRGEYLSFLGNHAVGSDYALIEYKVMDLSWAQFKNPAVELANWTASPTTVSPVVDGVDLATSSLAAETNLTLATVTANFDGDTFKAKGSGKKASDVDGLVSTVEPSLTLMAKNGAKTFSAKRSVVMFARAIPREAFPNPRQISK